MTTTTGTAHRLVRAATQRLGQPTTLDLKNGVSITVRAHDGGLIEVHGYSPSQRRIIDTAFIGAADTAAFIAKHLPALRGR